MMKKGDARLGSLIVYGIAENALVFMGFPFDEGCKRNGGRVGGAAGPGFNFFSMIQQTSILRSRSVIILL